MFSNNYPFHSGQAYTLSGLITSANAPSLADVNASVAILCYAELGNMAKNLRPIPGTESVEIASYTVFAICNSVYIAERVYDEADVATRYDFPITKVDTIALKPNTLALAVANVLYAIATPLEYQAVLRELSLSDLDALTLTLPREAIVQLFFARK